MGVTYSEYVLTVCDAREGIAMTWSTVHHRGEILRAVTLAADERRDGVLPMDVTGVHETFGDEPTLLAALQLRWHTRLSGHIERALLDHPSDPEHAVVAAWHATADELPGTRLILDRHRDEPLDDAMARSMATSVAPISTCRFRKRSAATRSRDCLRRFRPKPSDPGSTRRPSGR